MTLHKPVMKDEKVMIYIMATHLSVQENIKCKT